MAIELSKENLVDAIGQIKAIDVKLAEAKGTQAERTAKATEAVKSTPEGDKLAKTIASLTAKIEAAQGQFNDLVTAQIKATSGASSVVDTLKAQRATLVEGAEALRKVLAAFGVDVADVEVPGKAPRVSGGGTRGAKSSGTVHYRIKDGRHEPYANDTFSGLAFYAFNQCGTEALNKALAEAGITERTKAWGPVELTINGKTATVGMDVVEAEATEG